MDKLVHYRQLIQGLLVHYAEIINQRPQPNKETEVLFDEERDHYMLMTVGWSGTHRLRNTIVYVRIRNSKLWIEEDGLEYGIATDLLAAGVPKADIVLAFHPPEMRPLTEFAVA